VNKLHLIAPWLDPSRRKTSDFFEFTIDPQLAKRISEIHLYYSENDETEGVKKSVDIIRKTLPNLHYHSFTDQGHFTLEDMGTTQFPQLLNDILLCF
jgi:hypothetical protein